MSDKSNKNTVTPLEKCEKIELSKETVLKYISETFEKAEKFEELEREFMKKIEVLECRLIEYCNENRILNEKLKRCQCENEELKKRIENIKSIMKDL